MPTVCTGNAVEEVNNLACLHLFRELDSIKKILTHLTRVARWQLTKAGTDVNFQAV